MNFRLDFSISAKQTIGILLEISLDQYITLSSLDTLTILCLPTHEYWMCFIYLYLILKTSTRLWISFLNFCLVQSKFWVYPSVLWFFFWKVKKYWKVTPRSLYNLEKEQCWRTHISWLQSLLQSYHNQSSVALAEEQMYQPSK